MSSKRYQQQYASHQAGKIHVIPILLRPLLWDMLPIRTLQPLPHGGRAVTKWSNLDEAFENVTWGICEIVRVLIPKHILSLQETSILYSKEVNRAIYLQETSILPLKEVNQSRHLGVNRPVTEGLVHAPENRIEHIEDMVYKWYDATVQQPLVLRSPIEARETETRQPKIDVNSIGIIGIISWVCFVLLFVVSFILASLIFK